MIEQVTHGGWTYQVVEDHTFRQRLVVSGRVRVFPGGEAPGTALELTVSRRGLTVRDLGDGLLAVAADADRNLPHLATDPYPFDLHVAARGFRPVSRTIAVPAGSTLPLPHLDLELEPLPVRLQGRVVGVTALDEPPLPGATVRATDASLPALRTPAVFDHGAGTEVRACDPQPNGAPKAVEEGVEGGTDTVVLSDRQQLGAGDVVLLGPPRLQEYAVVANLPPEPADLNQPGEVVFTAPLVRSLRAGDPARRVDPTPQPANTSLSRDLRAGEGLLHLDADLPATVVRIAVPPAPQVEYHALGALTDAAGYYRLDGLGGVEQIRWTATAVGFDDLTLAWRADYRPPINTLDFRLDES